MLPALLVLPVYSLDLSGGDGGGCIVYPPRRVDGLNPKPPLLVLAGKTLSCGLCHFGSLLVRQHRPGIYLQPLFRDDVLHCLPIVS